MNREWKEVRLGDISIGNKGSYGIAASAVEYSKELFTYLRITDITDDGILIKEGLKSVDDSNAEKYVLKPNDIVFARTGNSTGRSYFYDGKDGELVYAGFLIKFSLDPKKVNPKYMRYYTLSAEYKNWVDSFKTGSTRGNINAQTYGNMKIKFPSRKQQDFLVSILSTLDEKIETNNQINKTLEKMAQTIFKHWFVDFEFPNENGEPYKSSGGEMIESELGMIPKGWDVVEIDDITEKANTGADAIRRAPIVDYETDVKCVRVGDLSQERDISGWGFCEVSEEDFKRFQLKRNDIIITRTGTIGLNIFILEDLPAVFNNGLIRLQVKKEYDSLFIYQVINSKSYYDHISKITGETSTRPNMKINYLLKYKFTLPPKKIINDFTKTLYSITSKIYYNNDEIEKLTQLRDLLLPKLMSGELRVPIKEGDIS